MRFLPGILLVLSLPAGAVGYLLAARAVAAFLPEQADGLIGLFVPLLVAGLFMMPFVAPFFDRMARRDLAAAPRSQGSPPENGGDTPGGHQG